MDLSAWGVGSGSLLGDLDGGGEKGELFCGELSFGDDKGAEGGHLLQGGELGVCGLAEVEGFEVEAAEFMETVELAAAEVEGAEVHEAEEAEGFSA